MSAIKGFFDTPLSGKIFFGSLKENSVCVIWNLLETDCTAKLEEEHFSVIHSPIDDFSIPKDPESFHKDVRSIVLLLARGKNIYVHCFSGHGRTGLAVLSLLLYLGIDKDKARQDVREHIGGPETQEQLEFATKNK
jgi:protein-tyrosine phosphatase